MLTICLRPLTLLLIGLVLTGCQLLNHSDRTETIEQGNADDWQAHKKQIMSLNTWQINGKVGIQSTSDSATVTLFWLQQFDYYDIRLSGPLGTGATRITGKPGHVTLEISGKGRFNAASPEVLLEQQTGWQLPISQLAWWIKGLPAPHTPNLLTLDDSGHLKTLKQNGWTIQYLQYENQSGHWLPLRIKAFNNDLKVTLICKQWTLRKQGIELTTSPSTP